MTISEPRDATTTDTEYEVEPVRRAAAAAVVAEAVAVASEAAAAEAAEAVLATAAAVTQAAGRAADAAHQARQARSYAAQAAAQAVAHEAERTAARLRARTDQAAARVEFAASMAAQELARSVASGIALSPRRLAGFLADTVRAAADEMARETTQAADVVATAAAAAATRVQLMVMAAESAADSDVVATAATLRALVEAAAATVALETDTQAAGVATTARTAAAALRVEQIGSSTGAATEIAAELSHDLRVPLSSIMASVEMLQDELVGHGNPVVAELLGRAARAGDRMVRMLDQNMALHQPDGPRPALRTDLGEIVRQLELDSADLLDQVGAVVEVGELPVLRADPDEMYSVLQNLVTNAIKFARPGTPAVVAIGARPCVGGWRISVRDNGIGLPPGGDLDVFSLFGRGTRDIDGHGIGLATVARIVASYGGRVGFSPVSPGAEIWFELPDVVSS